MMTSHPTTARLSPTHLPTPQPTVFSLHIVPPSHTPYNPPKHTENPNLRPIAQLPSPLEDQTSRPLSTILSLTAHIPSLLDLRICRPANLPGNQPSKAGPVAPPALAPQPAGTKQDGNRFRMRKCFGCNGYGPVDTMPNPIEQILSEMWSNQGDCRHVRHAQERMESAVQRVLYP